MESKTQSKWYKIEANRSGKCEQCNRTYAAGHKIWYSWPGKTLCLPCGNGEDSAELKIDSSTKQKLQSMKDRLSALNSLSKPLSPKLTAEFADLVFQLKEFSWLRSVESFLQRL